ncbi:TPA: helix-turn-helix transcriptional regulator [Candidatus Scatousia excrementigallinarum]|uniref:Helix-turn-helix transcriptional regulator n=1 Tax=Candidatus Scatousia excrementigallinarum TaxID=2840935 RepID=A0A9D1JPS8_9BACT|nr:helix-turn-helix transcriptional regulator [Candidatus Scatousia excrementigallinarum]
MVNLSKLSESLKELMAEHNLNQVALAAKLGSGRTKFSDILDAKNAPNYNTFVKLIGYFNCSADFLLGLKEYPCEDVQYKPVQAFSERLRDMFSNSGTSQYAFVKQTKTSWSVLYNWLTGKTLPSVDNLVKVANYFSCSVDYLLGRV